MSAHEQQQEKQSLLPLRPALERRKTWTIAAILLFLFFVVTSIILYSIRYCAHHSCSLYGSQKGVTMIPSVGFRFDWTHITAIVLYIVLIVILAARPQGAATHWYVIPLLFMVGAQLGRTTYILVFDKQGYIHAQLADSWQRAAPDLLDHLESRYQCDGFDACSPILARAFGETIYAWGLALWMLKFVQMVGLLGCYSVFLYIDQEPSHLSQDIEKSKESYHSITQ
ncbi:hypothetical protein VTP01DRAFT_6569 [Rhizomucor pusillus]|uniref:uncharacterized protein n=1 Tax=Rhizomucor pusillus TaxID=4840 RepID=UPI0037449786